MKEITQVAQQMIELQKTAFGNVFNAMDMLQKQSEKMTKTFLDQVPAIPEAGKKTVQEWQQAFNKGREDLKRVVDDNFSKMEALFSDASSKA